MSYRFRSWVHNKWFEHLDELDSLKIRNTAVGDYDIKHYFSKYRWWLKDLYRRESHSSDSVNCGDMGWTSVPADFHNHVERQ